MRLDISFQLLLCAIKFQRVPSSYLSISFTVEIMQENRFQQVTKLENHYWTV
jgi:stress response protein SCP2